MAYLERLKWMLWNGWYGYLGDKLSKKKSPHKINHGGKISKGLF